jgi:hypothetical protein
MYIVITRVQVSSASVPSMYHLRPVLILIKMRQMEHRHHYPHCFYRNELGFWLNNLPKVIQVVRVSTGF